MRWVLVAAVDGEPVGFAAREADDGHVSDLWIAPGWQGQGAGTELLTAMERLVRATDAAEITLEALHDNIRARSFYARRGFLPVWRGTVHDPILGVPLDRVRLARQLRRLTRRDAG